VFSEKFVLSVDVDVTITNKNKSTKASTKEASSTKGNINKPEPAKDSPRKVRTTLQLQRINLTFHLQFWLSLVHYYHYFCHRVSL
jgi:hypothetical protein